MGIFGKKTRYLGVDIGASNLKLVEIENRKDKFHLLTLGTQGLRKSIVRESGANVEAELARTLKIIVDEARVSTRQVVAGLPGFTAFTSIITIPKVKADQLDFTIRGEASKYIPTKLSDVSLDWKIIGERSEVGKGGVHLNNYEVLLISAPLAFTQKYQNIFSQAGLEMVALELNSIAMARSLVGKDPSANLIIDIGLDTTAISVVTRGNLKMNRHLNIAGQAVTEAIANKLGVSVEEAENYKREYGLTVSEEGKQIGEAVQNVIDEIIKEAERVLRLYQARAQDAVQKIVLTGSASLLKNFDTYLNQRLQIPVYHGDPWSQITYDEEIKSILDESRTGFAVAVGLALRQFDN